MIIFLYAKAMADMPRNDIINQILIIVSLKQKVEMSFFY